MRVRQPTESGNVRSSRSSRRSPPRGRHGTWPSSIRPRAPNGRAHQVSFETIPSSDIRQAEFSRASPAGVKVLDVAYERALLGVAFARVCAAALYDPAAATSAGPRPSRRASQRRNTPIPWSGTLPAPFAEPAKSGAPERSRATISPSTMQSGKILRSLYDLWEFVAPVQSLSSSKYAGAAPRRASEFDSHRI